MQRLLNSGALQAKLRISQPDDSCEREADRVAGLVMRMPAGKVQGDEPSCAACAGSASPCSRCRNEPARVARRLANVSAGESYGSGGSVPDGLIAGLGPGRPLDPATRTFFEPRFGQDFSHVRVFTGAAADASTRGIDARAFTLGSRVVFAAGEYDIQTARGRGLLAHELAHVVQQRSAPAHAVQRRAAIGEPFPPLNELDFDAIADQVFDAMDRIGTDEEAVYNGLQKLRGDPTAINTLIQRYAQRHDGANLINDINDEFSEEELEYALQLLGIGHAGTPQEIVPGAAGTADLARSTQRLYDAMEDMVGTDEEAVYATLLPFNRATQDLEQLYLIRFSQPLREVIIDEMSGDERQYALSLLSFNADYFLEQNFEEAQRPIARKILNDILAVKGDRLDFSDDQELAVEISKRLRTSQLLQESQTIGAFAYPESCTQDDCPGSCIGHGRPGEPGYVPPNINFNAHVNKDARDYWVAGVDAQGLYMFTLTREGWDDPFQALVKLFTPQDSICDRTLIHCDYLTTVIHLRAFAESIGPDVFERRVRRGEIVMNLSYWGFRNVMPPVAPGAPEAGYARTPTAVSLQAVRPSSEDDLLIGDHVVFWNHLAYDALTFSATWAGPWRLENALLVDQDSAGNNLYEGHGAPTDASNVVRPGDKRNVLRDMVNAYNGFAGSGPASRALALTRDVDHNVPGALAKLLTEFPRVVKGPDGKWWIIERDDRSENRERTRRAYELRELVNEDDPELIGLRDPGDPTKMGWVKRPIESAPGRSPSRPK